MFAYKLFEINNNNKLNRYNNLKNEKEFLKRSKIHIYISWKSSSMSFKTEDADIFSFQVLLFLLTYLITKFLFCYYLSRSFFLLLFFLMILTPLITHFNVIYIYILKLQNQQLIYNYFIGGLFVKNKKKV